MDLDLPSNIATNISKFTGRTWLLPVILKWIEKPEDRVFILTGEPGSGKSMVAAWFAGEGPSPSDSNAESQLKCIRSLVKAAHFCVTASGSGTPGALIHNLTQQLAFKVPGFSEALATILDQRVTISIKQVVNKVEPGGSVIGVHIEKLDLKGLDEDESFNRALRYPLKKLYQNKFSEPLVIIIDALDEAITYSGKKDIVILLSQLENFPEQVRFLVTTRPDPRVLKYYKDAKIFDFIKDASNKTNNDILQFTNKKFKGLNKRRRNKINERVTRAAKGNFLYAQLAIDDLLSHLPNIPDLDSIQLPQGLSELYQKTLNRELGTDEKQWYESFKPVLGLIAVSQGTGLIREQIENILERDVEQILRTCKQYLSGDLPNGPFRCFHKSFSDFLLHEKENIDNHIEASLMHNHIAAHYFKAYEFQWTKCNNYGLRYLPTHLIMAENWNGLADVLSDLNFIEAKCVAGMTSGLITDFSDCFQTEIKKTSYSSFKRIKEFENFVRRQAHLFRKHPHLILQQGVNEPNNSLVHKSAQSILSRGKKKQPWICWLNKPQHKLLAKMTLIEHGNWIHSCVYSPDGRLIISGDINGKLKIWDSNTGENLKTLSEDSERAINTCSFSPNGKSIVTGSGSGSIRIWDVQTGKKLKTLSKSSNILDKHVSCCSFSPDGRFLVSGSWDGTLKIWDVETTEKLYTLTGHIERVHSCIFSPDGRKILSAGGNPLNRNLSVLKIWDFEKRKELLTLSGHSRCVWTCAYSPNSKYIVSGSDDRTLKIWDAETGEELYTLSGHTAAVHSCAYSPDGSFIMSGGGLLTGELKIWNSNTRKEQISFLGHSDTIYACAVSPDSKSVVSASMDGTLKVWSVIDEPSKPLLAHKKEVNSSAFSSNGRQICSASKDGTIKIWDTESGDEELTIFSQSDNMYTCIFTNDDKQIVSASNKGLQVWDVTTGEELIDTTKHKCCQEGCSFSKNGERIASPASEWETIIIADTKNDKNLIILKGHPEVEEADQAVFDAEERGVEKEELDKLYDTYSELFDRIALDDSTGHWQRVNVCEFSNSGHEIATGSWDSTIKIWDAKTGEIKATLRGHDGYITSLAYSPDDKRIVSGDNFNNLIIWNAEDAEIDEDSFVDEIHEDSIFLIKTIEGHTDTINDCAYSVDGKLIISGSEDLTLRVWDAETGEEIAIYHADGQINTVDITHFMNTIVAGDNLGNVYVLRLMGNKP